jgi:hypothetical protein
MRTHDQRVQAAASDVNHEVILPGQRRDVLCALQLPTAGRSPELPALRNTMPSLESFRLGEIDRMIDRHYPSLQTRPFAELSPTPIPPLPPVHDKDTVAMASIIARRAFSTTVRRLATSEEALKTESKKNPEIMVRQIPTATPRFCAAIPRLAGHAIRRHRPPSRASLPGIGLTESFCATDSRWCHGLRHRRCRPLLRSVRS